MYLLFFKLILKFRTIEEYKSKMKKYEDEILKSKLNQIESCSQMKKLNNLKQNLIEKSMHKILSRRIDLLIFFFKKTSW